MRRTLRTALAAAALLVTVPVVTSAAPHCADEARRTRPDGWTLVRRPAFSQGEPALTSWAAASLVDGFMLATNGTAIVRSLDGGCSWEETYTPGTAVGETRLVTTTDAIRDVAMPPSPPGRLGYTAYALVADIEATRILTTNDLGETWHAPTSLGLPPITAVHGMWVSANPNTAFVLVDAQSTLVSAVETTLYVTRDAGATFAPVTRGLEPKQYTNLAVDPIDARTVWAWDEDSVFRSTDAGASFHSVDVEGPVSTIDLLHFPAFEPSRVVVYRKDAPVSYVSRDGGLRWKPEPTPGRVTSAANLYNVDAVAMASDTGVHLRTPAGTTDASPQRLRLGEVAFGHGTDGVLTLYARGGNDLYLRRFTPRLKPKLPPVVLRGGAVIKPGPTALRPARQTVRLRPGQRSNVEYTLDLAPVPTPLDVFFATDSTGSMDPVIASLRKDLQDIIDDLGETGIDVNFGVGDFRDYPLPGFGMPDDYPYKLRREVGPIDGELADAIEAIQTGGGVTYDSALAATYQAATGLGQPLVAGQPNGGWLINPGMGAGWRPNSLKVLVIAADVRSRDPQTDVGYPGPSYAQVIAALNKRGIEHVGLAVGDTPAEPFQSLSRISRGTGTLAPPGGIDCDDDGEVDLVEGEPLVCELAIDDKQSTNLTPAMVGLLRSLRDLQDVGMTLGGDARAARLASPPVFGEVNVKVPNRLPFTVQVSCAVDMAGHSYPVTVRTQVAERVVANAALTVECEPLPGKVPPAQPDPPKAPYVVAAAAPVGAAPPPPAPIPHVNPQLNTNPNPNPNPNPQAGMAHQERTQAELALATNDVTEDQELAMVGLAAGVTMAAGCAAAFRRREQVARSSA
ncbi:MAG TPA: hypothetical protein VGX28_15140 [Frankiaceae bacterium]|jgi:photosystem II stability/assembly factor-like uncharacterized protein|nr:hypothetical protein [Frankiaceae bacterium]